VSEGKQLGRPRIAPALEKRIKEARQGEALQRSGLARYISPTTEERAMTTTGIELVDRELERHEPFSSIEAKEALATWLLGVWQRCSRGQKTPTPWSYCDRSDSGGDENEQRR
jgi:hypothetical protein